MAGKLLKKGSKGPEVNDLQKALNNAGAKPKLTEDGKFGPGTESAVRAFQKKNGLQEDGVVGPNTRAKLDEQKSAQPTQNEPNVHEVRNLQKALNAAGADPPLKEDGKPGTVTELAVIEFQKMNGLKKDGDVGPKTTKVLAKKGGKFGLKVKYSVSSGGVQFSMGRNKQRRGR